MSESNSDGENEMKSKKKVSKPLSPEAAAAEEAKVVIYDAYCEFTLAYRLLKEGTKAWRVFLTSEYREHFKQNIPVDVPWVLIRSKIEYHLLVVEGYQKAKIPVSAKMQQNYDAAQALDINKFHKDTASLLAVSLDRMGKTTKEDAMAKAKKVVKVAVRKPSAPAKAAKKEKAPRVTVSGIFREIFEANFSKKLTDEQIAKAVNTKSKDAASRGHTYGPKDVPVVRRKFNLGLLSGQEGKKPAKELEKFEAKK